MPGIRRITLNNNPLINDSGALYIADALKDDLWLKGEYCEQTTTVQEWTEICFIITPWS